MGRLFATQTEGIAVDHRLTHTQVMSGFNFLADNLTSFVWVLAWSVVLVLWKAFDEFPPAKRAFFTILGPWSFLAFGIASDEGFTVSAFVWLLVVRFGVGALLVFLLLLWRFRANWSDDEDEDL